MTVVPATSLRKDTAGPHFRRVLIANRGEIALRILRACRELGMEVVAVYSDADTGAPWVRQADVAIRLGPAPAGASYLRADLIIDAARKSRAEAIHPGYGFLSEQATFARAVQEAGIVFVGPRPDAIAALGDKLAARKTAAEAGVPVVPGSLEAVSLEAGDVDAVVAQASEIGFPLMVKAAAGGGGRGMRRAASARELPSALAAGSAEAASAFGDGRVYLEREIRPARHIEVQLLGDSSGRVVALGERDCSIQRRHQKLVEEAPAPGLGPDERRRLHDHAVRAAVAAGLENAATAEFLRDANGDVWFLEVNARLQVEHGVTELVTGIDIVQEQFRIAAGRPLSDAVLAAAERAARPDGHAIEVRLSAEDPARDFAPGPGRVGQWVAPGGPGVRVDSALEPGALIPGDYDPLVAKVLVHAADRDAAIARLRRALAETELTGIQTTLPFHRRLAVDDAFRLARLSTDWVAEHWDGPGERAKAARLAALVAGLATLGDGSRSSMGGSERPSPRDPDPGAEDGWPAASRRIAVYRWPR